MFCGLYTCGCTALRSAPLWSGVGRAEAQAPEAERRRAGAVYTAVHVNKAHDKSWIKPYRVRL